MALFCYHDQGHPEQQAARLHQPLPLRHATTPVFLLHHHHQEAMVPRAAGPQKLPKRKASLADRRCYNCGIGESPMWRRQFCPTGLTSCNACYLYAMHHNGAKRPPELAAKSQAAGTRPNFKRASRKKMPSPVVQAPAARKMSLRFIANPAVSDGPVPMSCRQQDMHLASQLLAVSKGYVASSADLEAAQWLCSLA